MKKVRNLAVLPARAGSKRIPNKNLAPIGGRPLLYYPIAAALETHLFEEVMVSTDSEKIAAAGQEFGAQVPFLRSPGNSDDFATTLDVLKEVLLNYKKMGREFENVCCIYPTAIFTSSSDLVESFDKLQDGGYEGVVATTNFDFHPLRGFSLGKDDCVKYNWPEYITTRTQDLPKMFHDAGMFYWCQAEAIFKKNKTFISEDFSYYHIDSMKCQDIDDPEDLEIAEFKFKYLMQVHRL